MQPCRITVEHGSLTESDVLVLVNASNTNVQLGSGVSGAIGAACGSGYQAYLLDELQKRRGGPMLPGEVLVTNAGTHPCAKYVAHVAVMDYRQGFTGDSYPDKARIVQCCTHLWSALETLSLSEVSVAMVALGAGTGRLGERLPTQIACKTLQAHFEAHTSSSIKRVIFYGYLLPGYAAMIDEVDRVFPLDRSAFSEEVWAFAMLGRKRSDGV